MSVYPGIQPRPNDWPRCVDCGAQLRPGKRHPGSDQLCMRCHKARAAGEDAA